MAGHLTPLVVAYRPGIRRQGAGREQAERDVFGRRRRGLGRISSREEGRIDEEPRRHLNLRHERGERVEHAAQSAR